MKKTLYVAVIVQPFVSFDFDPETGPEPYNPADDILTTKLFRARSRDAAERYAHDLVDHGNGEWLLSVEPVDLFKTSDYRPDIDRIKEECEKKEGWIDLLGIVFETGFEKAQLALIEKSKKHKGGK
jgi:hypothetical protein